MLCNELHICSSMSGECRTGKEDFTPLSPSPLLYYYYCITALALYLCPLYVSDVKSTSNNPFKIESSSQIESASKLFCFIFYPDYPLTFINAREIDKQIGLMAKLCKQFIKSLYYLIIQGILKRILAKMSKRLTEIILH